MAGTEWGVGRPSPSRPGLLVWPSEVLVGFRPTHQPLGHPAAGVGRGLVSRQTGYPLPSRERGPEPEESPEQQGRRPRPLELKGPGWWRGAVWEEGRKGDLAQAAAAWSQFTCEEPPNSRVRAVHAFLRAC